MTEKPLTPAEQVRRLYEDAENRTATGLENLVASNGFGEVLSMVTGNMMALTRMTNVGLDQLVRGTRLAGRSDITRLGRQLARTEDKLEQVLQLVERLEAELAATRHDGAASEDTEASNQRNRTPRSSAGKTQSSAAAAPARTGARGTRSKATTASTGGKR